MTTCPALSTVTQDTAFITKDNVNELVTNTDDRTEGTVVSLKCQASLNLIGDSIVTCQSDGRWSYSRKPYCTEAVTETPTEDGGLDDQTKIMIGVVAAVAGLIIIALVCMICYIWFRERKRKREEKRLVYGFADDRRYPERYRDGPSTVDNMEMYNRGSPHYVSRPRDYEYDRGSRLASPMYLPENRKPDYHEYYDKMQRSRKPRYDEFDDRYSDPGRKPYVRDWVTRNSIQHAPSDEFLDRPKLHAYGRSRRDPYLWRNA